jgi:hypothetical protein
MVKCGNCGCNIDPDTSEFFFVKGAESMDSIKDRILRLENENAELKKSHGLEEKQKKEEKEEKEEKKEKTTWQKFWDGDEEDE